MIGCQIINFFILVSELSPKNLNLRVGVKHLMGNNLYQAEIGSKYFLILMMSLEDPLPSIADQGLFLICLKHISHHDVPRFLNFHS